MNSLKINSRSFGSVHIPYTWVLLFDPTWKSLPLTGVFNSPTSQGHFDMTGFIFTVPSVCWVLLLTVEKIFLLHFFFSQQLGYRVQRGNVFVFTAL